MLWLFYLYIKIYGQEHNLLHEMILSFHPWIYWVSYPEYFPIIWAKIILAWFLFLCPIILTSLVHSIKQYGEGSDNMHIYITVHFCKYIFITTSSEINIKKYSICQINCCFICTTLGSIEIKIILHYFFNLISIFVLKLVESFFSDICSEIWLNHSSEYSYFFTCNF